MTKTINRRTLVGGSIACALALTGFRKAATVKAANLYVYPDRQSGKTVISVLWADPVETLETRIHAGTQTWTSHGRGASIQVELRQPVEIWAERITRSGMRERVGSPFLTEILERSPQLAELYHSTSPREDRQSLFDAIAKLHGRRLAALILPDALRYDPSQPTGFNFAVQNGRRLEDDSAQVARTIISGRVG